MAANNVYFPQIDRAGSIAAENYTLIDNKDTGLPLKITIKEFLNYIQDNIVIDIPEPEETVLPFVLPEMYGAVGNGIVDDSAAIQLAINSGIDVYFTNKIYKVENTINLSSKVNLFGNGATLQTTSNIAIFKASTSGEFISINDFIFKGNNTGIQQMGISILGLSDLSVLIESTKISNCTFLNLTYGFYTKYNFSSGISKFPKSTLIQCYARNCNVGFFCAEKASQNFFEGCHAVENSIGLIDYGASNKFSGGSISGNATGIDINGQGDTSNLDGYSSIIGTTMTRNDTVIRVEDRPYGYSFIGCDIINNGAIRLATTDIINFESCKISVETLTINNCTELFFRACSFIENPVFAVTLPASKQKPAFMTCNFVEGRPTEANIAVDIDSVVSTEIAFDIPSIPTVCTFTGNADAIWILPSVLGYAGLKLPIINNGTANLTIKSFEGTAKIFYAGSAVTEVTLTPGDFLNLVNNTIYYLSL